MAKFSMFTSRAEPSAADRAVKAAQQAEFVRDLWLVIASVIGFLTIIRLLRLGLWYIRKPNQLQGAPSTPATEKTSPEDGRTGSTGKVSWRRIPAALASGFRIVAFRLSIPIGPGSVASIAELSFICGYIAVMFILLFNHSKCLNYSASGPWH